MNSGIMLCTKCLVLVTIGLFGCAAPEVEKVAPGLVEVKTVSVETVPSVVKVSKISTEALIGKIRITVKGDSEFMYTAFRLRDPLRLVLDLPHVDTSQISEVTFPNMFPLLRITPFQFPERETVSSRIEIALARLVPYQIFSEANMVFIDLEVPGKEIAVAPSTPTLIPPGFEELRPTQEKLPVEIEAKPEEVSPKISELVTPQPGVPTIEIVKPPKTVGEVTPQAGIIPELSVIKDIEVLEIDGKTRIIIYTDQVPEFVVKQSESSLQLIIDLKQSILLPEAEKVIIPDAVESPVKRVQIFQLRQNPHRTDNAVQALVDLTKLTQHEVIIEPEQLILTIGPPFVGVTAVAPIKDEKILEVPLIIGLEEALKTLKEKESSLKEGAQETLR